MLGPTLVPVAPLPRNRNGAIINFPAIAITDASGPACMHQIFKKVRPQGRVVGPIEEARIQRYEPYFKHEVAEHDLPTEGTTRPHLMEKFGARAAELDALTVTQKFELETVDQELRRTGVATINLSSSRRNRNDDDDLENDIAENEKAASAYGTAYITPDPALLQRLEWEQYILKCEAEPTKVFWTKDKAGQFTTGSNKPARELPPATIITKFKTSLLAVLGQRTPADLDNDRARARHYGVLGSILYGIKYGWHEPFSSLPDLKESRIEDEPFIDENDALFPVTFNEVKRTLELIQMGRFCICDDPYETRRHRGDCPQAVPKSLRVRLSPQERDWIEEHPEEIERLRSLGLVSLF